MDFVKLRQINVQGDKLIKEEMSYNVYSVKSGKMNIKLTNRSFCCERILTDVNF